MNYLTAIESTAGTWAIVAIAIWLAMFLGYLQLPTRFDPLAWHIQEMLFGFVMAAVAGFLLTAIPNWAGRLPARGRSLALLAGLWLLGRIVCLISADLPAWLAILADLTFPVVLLAVAAREIIVGRNWRNRVAASWNRDDRMILLALSAACWMAAFGLFEIVDGPMLLTRQPTRSAPSP